MKKGILLLSVILVAAIIAGFVFNINDGNAKEVEGLVIAYENYKEMVSAIGYVGYENEVVIKSQVGGIVDFFPYSVGDRIDGNSQVAGINNEEALLLLENDMIALDLAKARLADYDSSYNNAYSSVSKQRNVISKESEGINLSLAQLDERIIKIQSLVAEGYASEEELRLIEDQRDQLAQSISTLNARKSALVLPSYSVEELTATITAREQLIKISEKQLEKYEIFPPYNNGIVVETYVNRGEYVNPGQSLIKIVTDEEKFVEVDIDESFLSKIQIGDQAVLILEGLDKTVKGQVVKIAPTINIDNGTVRVTMEILENLDAFLENMTVQVDFTTFFVDQAVVISGDYIVNDNGTYVYVLLGEGQVEKRPVQVYNQNFNQVYITGGLDQNETILLAEDIEDYEILEVK
jgi:RND family efflux transporter MFP subunit